MSILVNRDTRVICQGITGKAGAFHTKGCLDYGTNIVGGVTPGKAGETVEGVPVFDTVTEAVAKTGANATMIFVPAAFTADAILEAVDAGIQVIVAITEGVPVLDMIHVYDVVKRSNVTLIGPNCPGIITAEECKIGIMPGYIHRRGCVGVISRSGTLTYEAVWQTTNLGLGQSTCVGLGGDPIVGTSFIDLLKQYESDPQTEAILMIGEIGGSAEEEAAGGVPDRPTVASTTRRRSRRCAGSSRRWSISRRRRACPTAYTRWSRPSERRFPSTSAQAGSSRIRTPSSPLATRWKSRVRASPTRAGRRSSPLR